MSTFRADRWAVLGLAAALVTGLEGPSGAQVGVSQAKSSRGGLLARADGRQFEVLFYPTGVRVFPHDATGAAAPASKLATTATFYHPNSPQPWFSRPLHATVESLDLAIGLGNAPTSGTKVTFEITGLVGAGESTATFTVPLEFVPQPTAQPRAPLGDGAAVPRYTYGPGNSGYGYYPYSSPSPSAPPARAYYGYSSPSRHFRGDGDSVGAGHRDWTTGRDSPIAKPWLRPMD